jgi:hypothetical protein
VDWWIDFETLIGQQANKSLIAWDYDVDISVDAADFRKHFPDIMRELHQCDDPESPLYYKRFFPDEDTLYGKFQTKWEPRFWLDIHPWKVDKLAKTVTKDGWGNPGFDPKHPEEQDLNYDLIFPISRGLLYDVGVPIPHSSERILNLRYGHDWSSLEPPYWYRPDLEWGSAEMKQIKIV